MVMIIVTNSVHKLYKTVLLLLTTTIKIDFIH